MQAITSARDLAPYHQAPLPRSPYPSLHPFTPSPTLTFSIPSSCLPDSPHGHLSAHDGRLAGGEEEARARLGFAAHLRAEAAEGVGEPQGDDGADATRHAQFPGRVATPTIHFTSATRRPSHARDITTCALRLSVWPLLALSDAHRTPIQPLSQSPFSSLPSTATCDVHRTSRGCEGRSTTPNGTSRN